MKNKMFSGWKDVLLFTFKQGLNKKYKIVTLILVVILFGGCFGFNLFAAMRQQKHENVSPVEKVYLFDDSGVKDIKWNESKQLDKGQFPNVVFEETSLDLKELGIRLMENEPTSVIASVAKEKDAFKIQVYLPKGSEVTKDDGENLAKAIKSILYEGIINETQIDKDKIVYVVSGITTEYSTAGEETKDEDSMMFKSLFPMFFMLGLYFMVIIYGQSMGQIVCIEKSSKLMESLLVMTRPYGLIFGKILATAGIAIFQMAVCIGSLIAGFALGDSFARTSIYANYENPVLEIFKEIASAESNHAFTVEAIVLTVVTVMLAFVFYCMLAGAIASFASKAEELGSVMMFYNIFIVIGFLGSYALPMASGQEWLMVIVRLIPMSASFMLPGEILLGTVRPGAAMLYIIVLMAWIVFTAVFAGKIYRDQVFYNGKSLKDRLPWMKNKTLNREAAVLANESGQQEEKWQYLHDEAGKPLEKSQRIGYFFLALSPLGIFFVVQIFTSLVLTNVITRWNFRGIDISTWEVKQLADYYHKLEPTLNPLTMMVNHVLLLTIFGLWLYFIRRGIDRNNIVHIKSLFAKKFAVILGICLICGLGLLVLANGVVAVEAYVIPSVVEEYAEMAKTAGMGTSPFAIIAAVCLAPIGEELLCRGVCLHFGKKALGKFWYANILQALLFGVLHMNWVQGVYAFIIGLVLGYLAERYESLLPAMLVHFVVNFSSSTWFPKVVGEREISLSGSILMVAIPGIIVFMILYLNHIKNKA